MLKIVKYGSNHVVISLNSNLEILFSYREPVAGFHKGYFKTDKYWSKTTSKHINAYLDRKNTELSVKEVSQEDIYKLLETK